MQKIINWERFAYKDIAEKISDDESNKKIYVF